MQSRLPSGYVVSEQVQNLWYYSDVKNHMAQFQSFNMGFLHIFLLFSGFAESCRSHFCKQTGYERLYVGC